MNVFRTLLLSVAAVAGSLTSASLMAAEKADKTNAPVTTAVLVHGAFADGSSWQKIIPLLQAEGLKVVAVQNPLTSLADDVAFTQRAIDAQTGPVVLVGHSWGGSVITQAGDNDKVKALVYVAALVPSAGETSLDGVKSFPAAPGLANPVVTPDGYLTLAAENISNDFAQDVSAEEANLIAITQGAIRGANFQEKLTSAAWSTKPSWYIVADQDRMINPDAQRALAKKIKATTTTLTSSHVPMLSKPQEVADVILAAAKSVK